MQIISRLTIRRLPLVILLLSLVSACANPPGAGEAKDSSGTAEYDHESWKGMIDSECRSFFDGCNNCRRDAGKQAACTLMACETYRKPRCLDEEAAASSPAATAKRVDFVCDGGNQFSVSYHEYRQDDQRVKLQDDEIMFSDRQTVTAYRLKRVRSASGEKYSDTSSGLEFSSKGGSALVSRQGERLYSNCSS